MKVKCDNCGRKARIPDGGWPWYCACNVVYSAPGVVLRIIGDKTTILLPGEAEMLFPGEDPTLLGNRIKALTDAIGLPECSGCKRRQKWLNRAHAWLRGQL